MRDFWIIAECGAVSDVSGNGDVDDRLFIASKFFDFCVYII